MEIQQILWDFALLPIFANRLPEIVISFCLMVINAVYLLKTNPSDNGSSDSFNVIGKFDYDRFYEVNVSFMEYLSLNHF